MIDGKSAEEITESLMELPREMLERIKVNTEMIKELNENQDRFIRLIAGLHDIDLTEIRAQIVADAVKALEED